MLSELKIKHAGEGMHSDGDGLYLQVSSTGAKSWIFRYQLNRRRREMGLGALTAVPAKEARKKAIKARALLADGIDPVDNRERMLAELSERDARDRAQQVTFKAAAETYIKANRAGWKNSKHLQQWENTLATYAYPVFGSVPVGEVDDAAVLKVLQPIWETKTETASRLRGRIECILDAAKARKLRQGENPARWRGHLDKLLPKPAKVAKVRHHPAMPYGELSEFVADLRAVDGVSALAVEFLIYTAARSGEVLRATWDEFAQDGTLWSISGDRMKAGRVHRVPLSEAAQEVLKRAKGIAQSQWVFPGVRSGQPMTDMSLTMLLRRMRPGYTVHGFRSSFRDWAAEQTEYPSEMAEMALAHVVSDKVEAAYRRGDMLERRRQMMRDWAAWCAPRVASAKAI
ncbi:Prophage CP4-57 integrase [Achromobacter xylosoxidans]|uniref:tyrosine-type recombinase/integrase n=1 Tax=Alcaligenes xylosoxydans xylosoxydans TaxID=85698 RepID=UPI0006C26C48|nr:site-specific integrase [Achromobacter xylosoxidans]CUI38580.1 Prophage CP4-57 integrase [Achromobacter xylosoxidans]